MKSLKIIIVISILSGNCLAQRTEFGFMGGMNLSDLGTLPVSFSSNSNTSYHIGGFLNIYLGRKFDLQPQFLYTNLGSSLTQSGNVQVSNNLGYLTETDNIALSYIQIPIYFVHKFGIGWDIHAGPYVGFLLTDKEEINQTVTVGNQTYSGDSTTNSTNGDYSIDIGLGLGIGYQMPSGLGFSLGYSFGLTKTFEPETGPYSYPAFGTNTWYSFSISYLLSR